MPAPPEPRRLVLALTAGEVGLAGLITWVLFRSRFAQHASMGVGLGAGEWFVLVAMGLCLAFFVFLLAFWQWRLSARGRFRLLLALFVSLLWAFCGLCWHDITVAMARLLGPGARPPLEQLREQSLAVGVTMAALVVGMVAVVAVLVAERRAGTAGEKTPAVQ